MLLFRIQCVKCLFFYILGPSLVGRLRSDIVAKYAELYDEGENPIGQYIYHCNAQKPR